MWNNVPSKLTSRAVGAICSESRSGVRSTSRWSTGHKTSSLKKMKWGREKKTDEIFPISEANRLLSPSLADVCGWLLLFDGANLNIPPVPWDCCLCLSGRDNTQKEDCFHILCHLIMTFRRTYSSQIHDVVVVIAPFWRNTINCAIRAWLNHQSGA